MKVRKAIIPAAGLGTRLLPNTKSIPKEMLPLVDKPVLQYIVEEAVAAGVEQILIITNRGKSPIEDYFDYAPDLEQRLIADGKRRPIERPKRKNVIHLQGTNTTVDCITTNRQLRNVLQNCRVGACSHRGAEGVENRIQEA